MRECVRSGRIQERGDDKRVDTVHNDTNDLWTARHQFKRGHCRILVDTLLCRRYRELNTTPRRPSIILPMQIRTLTTVERRGRHSIVLELGQTPGIETPETETITGHCELWTNNRPDLTTMSVAKVSALDFFPYESRWQLLDRIFGGVHLPAVQKLCGTSQIPHKSVDQDGASIRLKVSALKDALSNRSCTRPARTRMSTPSTTPCRLLEQQARVRRKQIQGAVADSNKKKASEIDRLRRAFRDQQSKYDRKIAELERVKGKAVLARYARYMFGGGTEHPIIG